MVLVTWRNYITALIANYREAFSESPLIKLRGSFITFTVHAMSEEE